MCCLGFDLISLYIYIGTCVSKCVLYLVGWCLWHRFLCNIIIFFSYVFWIILLKIYDPKLFKRFAIMNIKSFTSYTPARIHRTQPLRDSIFFCIFGKDKLWVGTSLRCTSHWLIWRRSVFAHLAYLMRCTFFIQQEACALRITLNYVHNGTVCRTFLPLITHMFCITCSACSLPSSANRTKVHTNERQEKKKTLTIWNINATQIWNYVLISSVAHSLWSLFTSTSSP